MYSKDLPQKYYDKFEREPIGDGQDIYTFEQIQSTEFDRLTTLQKEYSEFYEDWLVDDIFASESSISTEDFIKKL